jgi:hypothetical protein
MKERSIGILYLFMRESRENESENAFSGEAVQEKNLVNARG